MRNSLVRFERSPFDVNELSNTSIGFANAQKSQIVTDVGITSELTFVMAIRADWAESDAKLGSKSPVRLQEHR